MVADELRKGFSARFNKLLSAKGDLPGTGAAPTSLLPSHKFMAAVLESVNEIYKQHGIDLSRQVPDNLDEVLQAAMKSALGQLHDTDAASKLILLTVKSENFRPEAKKTLNLLYGGFKNTPFDRIKPEHRWRMCIDPKKVEELKRIGIDDTNPLLGFVFDAESAYLHGMAKGWVKSMQGVKHTVDSKLVLNLHEECNPATPAAGDDAKSKKNAPSFHEGESTFGLTPGNNMTPEGEAELKAFIEDLKYEIDIGLQPHGDGFKLVRGETDHQKLKELIDGWVKNYNKARKANPEDIVSHVVDLCQKMERLHPFGDGNCRTFGIFLLNHLLLQAGESMTMLDDPNLIDGFSVKQAADKVREGQQRVAEWSDGAVVADSVARSRMGGGIRQKLMGMLSSGAGK